MTLRVFLFLSIFLSINFLFSQIPGGKTGSKLSAADAGQILEHHNKVRSEVGVPPLAWNPKLAAYAQTWANNLASSNNCNMKHRENPGEDGKRYGENIFWGSSANVYKPINASLAWYDEKSIYNYGPVTYNNFHRTGHYTQMIWKTTSEVGAGAAVCPNGGIIVVANYYPAGNIISQRPY